MKYNYDKSCLKGLGPGPFMKLAETRTAHIEKAQDTIPTSIYRPNILAKELHPHVQYGVIKEIKEQPGAKTYKIIANKMRGTKSLAFFRAGQYICFALEINGATLQRPYTLQSDPADALAEESSYTFTIKENPKGFAAPWILENWAVGTEVVMSGPLGNFTYQPIRDAKHVVAIAGGSGITPFHSMAAAIVSGNEKFDLTILYGSRKSDAILLKDELDELEKKSGGHVKVVHVLSDEEKEGFEHGFLTLDLVKKYAPNGDYSIFMCGPKAMYAYEDEALKPLGFTPRRLRKELSGEFGEPSRDPKYPAKTEAGKYSLTVRIRGAEQKIECSSSETLLVAMERAGIKAPSSCRSGECGWCHSLLVSGNVFIPEEPDKRRMADVKFNWIHPCIAYPLSDVIIDVPVTNY
ncbi:MAG: iron-sulfur cluster-binding domain-containing protein [Butyrivibrio sp.]|nr:iron-sulfur cluster-binding domain-containing protein [Butyrivibrio sp.]